MTIYVENETDFTFPFDTKELCSRVAEAVLDAEGCPYETEINVLITDNEGIRLYNKEYRNIDRETDVLSFPNIPFETEADFSIVEEIICSLWLFFYWRWFCWHYHHNL